MRVAVMDDSYEWREAFSAVLCSQGHAVLDYRDGLSFDVLVADAGMLKQNEDLRALLGKHTVIVVSASMTGAEALTWWTSGAVDVIRKDEHPSSLLLRTTRARVRKRNPAWVRALHDEVLPRLHAAQRMYEQGQDPLAALGEAQERIQALMRSAATPLVSPVMSQAWVEELLEREGWEGQVSITVEGGPLTRRTRMFSALLTEAVRNVVRHAQASRLEISLASGAEQVCKIVDNGQGLAWPTPTSQRWGMGMQYERARTLQAFLSITSCSAGTTVLCEAVR